MAREANGAGWGVMAESSAWGACPAEGPACIALADAWHPVRIATSENTPSSRPCRQSRCCNAMMISGPIGAMAGAMIAAGAVRDDE